MLPLKTIVTLPKQCGNIRSVVSNVIIKNQIKIQFTSDIHLEFYANKPINVLDVVTPCAPYLAIVGDLGYPTMNNFKEFLSQASKLYTKIFYVLGNHEYYQGNAENMQTYHEINLKAQETCNEFENIYCLNNGEHQLSDDVVILGSTLWTDIPNNEQYKIKQVMNDYRQIFVNEQHYKTNITPKFTSDLCKDNVTWLTEQLEKHKNKNVIILTHHLPSFQMIVEKYKKSDYNCAFA